MDDGIVYKSLDGRRGVYGPRDVVDWFPLLSTPDFEFGKPFMSELARILGDRWVAKYTTISLVKDPMPDQSKSRSDYEYRQVDFDTAISWMAANNIPFPSDVAFDLSGPEPVVLRGRHEPPIVLGQTMPDLLTEPAYDVIEALIKAGADGLGKTELEDVRGSAREILRNLRRSSPLWQSAIEMAVAKGKRYRIMKRFIRR